MESDFGEELAEALVPSDVRLRKADDMDSLGPIWMLPFSKGGRELLGEIFLRQERTAPPPLDPPEFTGHGTAAVSVCPYCGTENGVKHPVYFTYRCTGCNTDLSSNEMNWLRNRLAQTGSCDGL